MQNFFIRHRKKKQKMRKIRQKSFDNQFKNDSDAIAESFRQVGKDLNQSMYLINECIGIVAKVQREELLRILRTNKISDNTL